MSGKHSVMPVFLWCRERSSLAPFENSIQVVPLHPFKSRHTICDIFMHHQETLQDLFNINARANKHYNMYLIANITRYIQYND